MLNYKSRLETKWLYILPSEAYEYIYSAELKLWMLIGYPDLSSPGSVQWPASCSITIEEVVLTLYI